MGEEEMSDRDWFILSDRAEGNYPIDPILAGDPALLKRVIKEIRALREEVERLNGRRRGAESAFEEVVKERDALKARCEALVKIVDTADAGYHTRKDYPPFAVASWEDRTRWSNYIRKLIKEALREPAGKPSPCCCEPVMSAEQEPEGLKRLRAETIKALSRVKPADAGEGGEGR